MLRKVLRFLIKTFIKINNLIKKIINDKNVKRVDFTSQKIKIIRTKKKKKDLSVVKCLFLFVCMPA